jgi:F-box protein 11
MAKPKPAAFMSYVHSNDKYGHLTTLRERLSDEVRVQTGEEFPIFQDRKDIQWGQNWKARIEESLDAVTFLIPIITPSFFKSPYCREELQRFLERERQLGRDDLILPIYYVDCPLLNDETQRATDELAGAIASRQYADWRDLRFEPFTSPQVGRTLARLAVQIRDALPRGEGAEKALASTSLALAARMSQIASQPSEMAWQPSAKTEPPTHVVDPMHRGDYLTITEAIVAASPGDRILVRPGLYQEGLVVDKPLEIIGDGEPDEIVIQARGQSVLLFQTTMGRVANLTLRQIGDRKKCYGVDIAQGRLELEGCDITNKSLACVAIHGGADPRLRRNRIHDGKQSGVFVYDNSRGTLEDNDIFCNAGAGVEIIRGGNLTLRRNRIYENGLAAWLYDGGGGIIEDNDLRGNIFGAWLISADSEPNVKRARNLE